MAIRTSSTPRLFSSFITLSQNFAPSLCSIHSPSYLIHVAGHNLGILMRLLIGAGTPKEAAARGGVPALAASGDHTLAIVIFALDEAGLGTLVVIVTAQTT